MIVDDDDLEVDVGRGGDRVERLGDEMGVVVQRDDDADLGCSDLVVRSGLDPFDMVVRAVPELTAGSFDAALQHRLGHQRPVHTLP